MQITIRPLREEDAYTSVKWRNDREVTRYFGNQYDHEITIEDELAWIRKVMADPSDCRCAIECDGIYIGNIYLTGIADREAYYHIFIGDHTYWGKGIGREASRLLIEHARRHLPVDRILLRVRPENERACSLYDRLGFRNTGLHGDFLLYCLDLREDSPESENK